MKRFFLVILTAALMVASASMAGAWEVRIKNSCNKDTAIVVYGSHFFYTSPDCSTTVATNTTGTCRLPELIWISEIQGHYFAGRGRYYFRPIRCSSSWVSQLIACFWDVSVEVVQDSPDSCGLELR